jgi:RNA polymerase sigma-70 factor, ECF subfamily
VGDKDSIRKASDGTSPVSVGLESGGDVSPAYSAQPVGQGSPVPTDETELVRRARDNDPWAADQLVRRYQKKVYGIAYRLCGFDPEEARDTTQEAFLQAFRNISQFEGRSRFSTWLYRIAVNACLDAQRRRRRWVDMILPWRKKKQDEKDAADPLDTVAAPDDGSDPVSSVRSAELKRDVLSALRRLSEHQRTVFQLKVFQEMSIAEIAAVTGMAEGTVKSHLFRATQRVREQLRRWVER